MSAISTILDTSEGPIEYAVHGQGVPLLVSHGAAGGFDQGLLLASPLAARGFFVIAPSRDGYLRSPLAPASSPQSQADKYLALLDSLGIGSCAVLGVSAGGPSAIEFALRHAQRCRALLLVSAIVSPLRPAYLAFLPESVVIALISGPLFRAVRLRSPDRMLLRTLGVTSGDEHRASHDPGMTRALREILLAARDPQEARIQGMLADISHARHLPAYEFGAIRSPTLAIHGSADRFAPFRAVTQAAALIPQARVTPIAGAGHLCMITHSLHVCAEIEAFLAEIPR